VSGVVDAELERTIRDAYAAFAEGDIESVRELFHEDVIYSLFEFETVEVLEIAEAPRGVLIVLRYRGRGKASGAPVDVPMAHVLEYRDGRVARLAWYGTRDEAAEAAGLQP